MLLQRKISALAGLAAGLATHLFCQMSGWYDAIRERTLDIVTSQLSVIPQAAQPIVIDIDRATLRRSSSGQMRRTLLTDIITAAAEQKPRAIVVDVLIEGHDTSSAGYLARSLAEQVTDPAVKRLANELPDSDALLVQTAKSAPVVLGLALDPDQSGPPFPVAPVLSKGKVDASLWWAAPGIRGPAPALAAAAAGLGVLALPGDADATVRRVPLMTIGGDRAVPGLALEAIRVSEQAATILVSAETQSIVAGPKRLPIEADGMLRLAGSSPQSLASRTHSAAIFLDGASKPGQLTDRVVLIGSSAPELGGLRSAIGGGLIASVQIHADAIAQIKAEVFPRRTALLRGIELAASIVLAAAASICGVLVSPVLGAAVALLAAIAWIAGAAGLYVSTQMLADPVSTPLTFIAAFTASAISTGAATRRRALNLQRRFEQHLAPAVVRRILDNPELLKLNGERREVTSMFTDIEGFTAMTERAEPEALVAVLDAYFAQVSDTIVAHGGMIDKFVGDAVHALFNAPFDTADHAQCACRCARAIVDFSKSFQATPEALELGFGRTRIGIETGLAIVGDVGGAGKLDYTAHGTAVNTAARLEAANKELGSTICIGPGATALLPEDMLRPLGEISLRGRSSPQTAYEPWPPEYSKADQLAYMVAFATAKQNPAEAAMAFAELLKLHPNDQVLVRLAGQPGKRGAG